MIELYNGDCLIESDKIEDGSVDLILTDLPYGTMKNAPTTWDKSKTKWDTPIEPSLIMNTANRVLRKNGKMVLFSQEPYSTSLINASTPNIQFGYRAIWEKDGFANALGVNKFMVNMYEDVLVFSNRVEDRIGHKMQSYFLKEFKKCNMSVSDICEKLGTTNASHFFTKGKQFRVPNEDTFKELQSITRLFNVSYEDVKDAHDEFLKANRNSFPSTFNLWDGKKYKSDILKYTRDRSGLHPTQKPVLLLEDLIKTFSNEGDLVVDLTMGSGSTGVACKELNRKFIGIELDENYFNIAKKRINNHKVELQ